MKRDRRKVSPCSSEYSVKKQANLYLAVMSRDRGSIRAILKEKKGDNKVSFTNGPNKETALHLACSIGDVKIVKIMLKYLKDFDYTGLDILDGEGHTALERAAQKNFVDIIKLLQQVKEETPDNDGSQKLEKKRGRKKAGLYRPSYNPVKNSYEKQPPCTCCHICRNSISKKNREFICCSECHYVYCKACILSKTQFVWDDVKDDSNWVCRVCLGTCNCQRCQVRGPPRWYGHKAEPKSQTESLPVSQSQSSQQVSNPVQTSPPTEMPSVSNVTTTTLSKHLMDDNPFSLDAASEPIFGDLANHILSSSMCIEDIRFSEAFGKL